MDQVSDASNLIVHTNHKTTQHTLGKLTDDEADGWQSTHNADVLHMIQTDSHARRLGENQGRRKECEGNKKGQKPGRTRHHDTPDPHTHHTGSRTTRSGRDIVTYDSSTGIQSYPPPETHQERE